MGLVGTRRPVVLIVEDEFLLRMDAVDMITAAGFEAIEAANADEAIEILEARPDITVVFTDIQMPGSMDGLKLARAVRGRWPPIKIVATSGHVNVGETDLPEGGRFLPKPYSPMQVTGMLRELTGGCIKRLRNRAPGAGHQAMISGVIWSSMKAMRSRNCSLRFFSRCSRNKSGAGD